MSDLTFINLVPFLDFDATNVSWRVLDVSVAMAYAMLSSYGKDNRSISAAAALLRGYNAVYPLTEVERSHLVLLMACRLSCSVTLGAFSLQQNPANKYLLLHAEPAWKALEMLWGYDADERKAMTTAVDRVFRQACLYNDARGEIVTCYDLVLPDPSVADLLQSVRVSSTYDDLPSKCSNDTDDSIPGAKRQKVDNRVDSPDNQLAIITFVTGNAKKLEEVKRIFGIDDEPSALPFRLISMKIDLPELQGGALDVAREKAILAAEEVGGAVIVEDTSLCFNALNGLPGVFIKWFLESCGHDGLNKLLAGYEDKSAYAQTVVAFVNGPGQAPVLFDGRTTGKIVMPRGKLDFGWDPIFEPDEGNGKTYAEMLKEEKDAISHRSRAFQQLSAYLHTLESGAVFKQD